MFGDTCLGIISVDAKEEDFFVSEDLEAIEIYGEIATMVRFMQIAGYYQMRGEDTNAQNKS